MSITTKNKKIFKNISILISAIVLIIGTNSILKEIKPTYALDNPQKPTATRDKCLKMTNDLLEQIETNKVKLTYECFGAKGDGKTNDMLAIQKTHRFANDEYIKKGIKLTVYGNKSSKYYIGETIGLTSDNKAKTYPETYYESKKDKYKAWTDHKSYSIPVITDVDWQGANFIIEDYIDKNKNGKNEVDWQNYLFKIISPLAYATNTLEGKEVSTIEYNTTKVIEKIPKLTASHTNDNTTNLKALVNYVKNDSSLSAITKKYLKDSDKWIIKLTNNKSMQYIRQSENPEDPHAKVDSFIIDSTNGKILSPIDWDWAAKEATKINISIIPRSKTTIQGGNFTTYTNNQVYDSKGVWTEYSNRNIEVLSTGNVELKNINHYLTENKTKSPTANQKRKYANTYAGFFRIEYSANVILNNCTVSAHTPTYDYNKTSGVETGTYDLNLRESINVTLNKVTYPCAKTKKDGSTDWTTCYEDNILNEKNYNNLERPNKWGVMLSNGSKNIKILNSKINRVDAHRGMTNLYVYNSIIGSRGFTLIGRGEAYIESSTVDQAYNLISLRKDYGSTWDGTITLKNVNWKLPKDNNAHNVIFSDNNGNPKKYFGYKTYFPSVYISDLTVNATKLGTKDNKNINIFRLNEKITNPSGSNNNKAYYIKGNSYINNIKYENGTGKAAVFTNGFAGTTKSLASSTLLKNYGSNNAIKIAISKSSVIVPAINNQSATNLTNTNKQKKITVQKNIDVTKEMKSKNSQSTTFFNNNGATEAKAKPKSTSSNDIVATNITISGSRLNQSFSKSVTNYTANITNKTTTITVNIPDTVITASSKTETIKRNKNGSNISFTKNIAYGKNEAVFELVGLWGLKKQYKITITRNYNFTTGTSGYTYNATSSTLYIGTDNNQTILKKLNLTNNKELSGTISGKTLKIYSSNKQLLKTITLASIKSNYVIKKAPNTNQQVAYKPKRILPSLIEDTTQGTTPQPQITYEQFLESISGIGITIVPVEIPSNYQELIENIYNYYKFNVIFDGQIIDSFMLDPNLIKTSNLNYIENGTYIKINPGETVETLKRKIENINNIKITSNTGEILSEGTPLKTSDILEIGSKATQILVLGDLDSNGIVNQNDINILKNNNEDINNYVADVTDDGEIAINDIDKIDCYINGKISSLGGEAQ